jgi:hypothetical protein
VILCERLRLLYGRFDTIAVSFSGGKESTVCFHLALDAAKPRTGCRIHRTFGIRTPEIPFRFGVAVEGAGAGSAMERGRKLKTGQNIRRDNIVITSYRNRLPYVAIGPIDWPLLSIACDSAT